MLSDLKSTYSTKTKQNVSDSCLNIMNWGQWWNRFSLLPWNLMQLLTIQNITFVTTVQQSNSKLIVCHILPHAMSTSMVQEALMSNFTGTPPLLLTYKVRREKLAGISGWIGRWCGRIFCALFFNKKEKESGPIEDWSCWFQSTLLHSQF